MTDGDNEPEELCPAPATGGDEKTVANSDAKVATGAGKPGKNLGGTNDACRDTHRGGSHGNNTSPYR